MVWRFVELMKRKWCVMKQAPYKGSHKGVGFNPLVITKAQFCRMFYHVWETTWAMLEFCVFTDWSATNIENC